jgi:hypothetical protein
MYSKLEDGRLHIEERVVAGLLRMVGAGEPELELTFTHIMSTIKKCGCVERRVNG